MSLIEEKRFIYHNPNFTKQLTDLDTQHFYSESQMYEYIARVFYNVVFSTYLGSNGAGKTSLIY